MEDLVIGGRIYNCTIDLILKLSMQNGFFKAHWIQNGSFDWPAVWRCAWPVTHQCMLRLHKCLHVSLCTSWTGQCSNAVVGLRFSLYKLSPVWETSVEECERHSESVQIMSHFWLFPQHWKLDDLLRQISVAKEKPGCKLRTMRLLWEDRTWRVCSVDY